jgi:hypothetical protein
MRPIVGFWVLGIGFWSVFDDLFWFWVLGFYPKFWYPKQIFARQQNRQKNFFFVVLSLSDAHY